MSKYNDIKKKSVRQDLTYQEKNQLVEEAKSGNFFVPELTALVAASSDGTTKCKEFGQIEEYYEEDQIQVFPMSTP